MADIKISDLASATSASGAMQIEVNDSGTSKRITVDQIKAFAVSAGSIGTTQLTDASVTAAKLANSAVDLATAKVTGVLPVTNGGSGANTADGARVNLNVISSITGSQKIPAGTTAQRDGSPAAGFFRFNSTLGKFEGYSGTAWGSVGGGATGGGTDEVFVENSRTVSTNYTLTTGKNAMSVGAITINAGITVTVPSGARWVVL